jgi:hypothetical protein
MRPMLGGAVDCSQSSFATVRVQGPSEQTLIGLCLLSRRNAVITSVNIEPLKGEYR